MSFRPRLRNALPVTATAVALVLLASSALASGPAPRAKKRAQRPVAQASTAPVPTPVVAASPGFGLAAFLDPETGLLTGPVSSLVPPADQRASAAAVLLEPVQLPNGAWALDLKGTGMESYVLHLDALGNRTVTCVQDTRAVVGSPTPAPARKER
jgi:hypothetical protein